MSVGTRVFVGRVPRDARERDLEDLFGKYGTIVNVSLKTGFAFIEFSEARQAEDAVSALDGADMMRERIVVQLAKGEPRGRDVGGERSFGGRQDRSSEGYGSNKKKNRLIIENLDRDVDWKQLKDLFKKAGDVEYADAHRSREGSGVVDFVTTEDMQYAIKKFDDYEMNGKRLIVKEDRQGEDFGGSSRRRSRSRSPRRRYHSRSRTPPRRRSRSRSPYRNGGDKRDRGDRDERRDERGFRDERRDDRRDERGFRDERRDDRRDERGFREERRDDRNGRDERRDERGLRDERRDDRNNRDERRDERGFRDERRDERGFRDERRNDRNGRDERRDDRREERVFKDDRRDEKSNRDNRDGSPKRSAAPPPAMVSVPAPTNPAFDDGW